MLRTYKAILHGDRVEWLDQRPEQTQPLPVQITPLEDTPLEPASERGRIMAEHSPHRPPEGHSPLSQIRLPGSARYAMSAQIHWQSAPDKHIDLVGGVADATCRPSSALPPRPQGVYFLDPVPRR